MSFTQKTKALYGVSEICSRQGFYLQLIYLTLTFDVQNWFQVTLYPQPLMSGFKSEGRENMLLLTSGIGQLNGKTEHCWETTEQGPNK